MSLLISRFDAEQLFASDRLLRLREQSNKNNKFSFLFFYNCERDKKKDIGSHQRIRK